MPLPMSIRTISHWTSACLHPVTVYEGRQTIGTVLYQLSCIIHNQSVALARTSPTALATRACRQLPYLRPVPAATKPAILIMMSFVTEAGPWALAMPSATDVRMPLTITGFVQKMVCGFQTFPGKNYIFSKLLKVIFTSTHINEIH